MNAGMEESPANQSLRRELLGPTPSPAGAEEPPLLAQDAQDRVYVGDGRWFHSNKFFVPDPSARVFLQTLREQVPLNRRMDVLNIGIGPWSFALGLADRVGRLTAVDKDPTLAGWARENVEAYGLSNVQVLQAGASEFLTHEAAGRKYDLIIAAPAMVPFSEPMKAVVRGLGREYADAFISMNDGGSNGRREVDRLLEKAPSLLKPGGSLLLLHPQFLGLGKTQEKLASVGLQGRILYQEDIQMMARPPSTNFLIQFLDFIEGANGVHLRAKSGGVVYRLAILQITPAAGAEEMDISTWDYSALNVETRGGEDVVPIPAQGLLITPAVRDAILNRISTNGGVPLWLSNRSRLVLGITPGTLEVRAENKSQFFVFQPPAFRVGVGRNPGEPEDLYHDGFQPHDSAAVFMNDPSIANLHLEIDLVPDGTVKIHNRARNRWAYIPLDALKAIQAAVKAQSEPQAGAEEAEIVFGKTGLSILELKEQLEHYLPWGFDYYDGSQERKNYQGGASALPFFSPWEGEGVLSLFALKTERTLFDLSIQRGDPHVPPDRVYAVITGRSAGRAGAEEEPTPEQITERIHVMADVTHDLVDLLRETRNETRRPLLAIVQDQRYMEEVITLLFSEDKQLRASLRKAGLTIADVKASIQALVQSPRGHVKLILAEPLFSAMALGRAAGLPLDSSDLLDQMRASIAARNAVGNWPQQSDLIYPLEESALLQLAEWAKHSVGLSAAGAEEVQIQAVFNQLLKEPEVRGPLLDKGWFPLSAKRAQALGFKAAGGLITGGVIIADSAKLTDPSHAILAEDGLGNQAVEKMLAWIRAGDGAPEVVRNARLFNAHKGDLIVLKAKPDLTVEQVQALLKDNGIEGPASARTLVGAVKEVENLPIFAFQLLAGEEGLPAVVVLNVAVRLQDEAGNSYTLILMA